MSDLISQTFTLAVDCADHLLRVLRWLMLIVIPGATVVFYLLPNNASFYVRILVGVTLSPVILVFEFYVLRLSGLSFDATVAALSVLTLLTLPLILKRVGHFGMPSWRSTASFAAVAILGALCISPQLLNENARMFNGHAWMHADLVYMLSSGELFLEEPELAGVNLAYPWAGHAFQAILSYTLDLTPASSYIFTNLIWLLCFIGLVACVVKSLGGGLLAQISAFILLILGLNFIGQLIREFAPVSEFTLKLMLGGDYRYSPWVLKFYFFEQIPFGLGMYASLLCIVCHNPEKGLTWRPLALIGVLTLGVGVTYPILFPVAITVIVVRAVAQLVKNRSFISKQELHEPALLIFSAMFIGALTVFYGVFLMEDRVSPSIVFPGFKSSFAKLAIIKGLSAIIALGLYLLTIPFVFRSVWRSNRIGSLVLLAGGASSVLLNVLLVIPYWGNEYKFLFTAAISLAPFSGIIFEKKFREANTSKLISATIIVSFVLLAPFAYTLNKDYPWRKTDHNDQLLPLPRVDADEFYMVLADDEPFSRVTRAIRTETPPNTILILNESTIHLPTVTQRQLYVSPAQEHVRPGVNIESTDLLAGVRGYDRSLIMHRREVVKRLFDQATSPEGRRTELSEICKLGRPVAIITKPSHDLGLQDWLRSTGHARQLVFSEPEFQVWLIAVEQMKASN